MPRIRKYTKMTDSFAAAVQLVVLFLGFAACIRIGWLNRGPRNFKRIASSAGIALIVGFAFTYIAVLSNQICRVSLNLCNEHGDGNMTYWFYPFFAIPINWILILAFGENEEPYVFTPSPFDRVVDDALANFRRGEQVHQRCPSCQSIISINNVDPRVVTGKRRVHLQCACSKCDRLFELDSEII